MGLLGRRCRAVWGSGGEGSGGIKNSRKQPLIFVTSWNSADTLSRLQFLTFRDWLQRRGAKKETKTRNRFVLAVAAATSHQ